MEAEEFGSGEGLTITIDQISSGEPKNIIIRGVLSTFVNCGSQYATWRQFPRAIRYTVKNLANADIYNSINMELSISESGNDIFDFYSKEPCDTVVSKDFSVSLNNIYFEKAPKAEIYKFELQAEYAGHRSNTVTLKDIPISLKTF